MHAPVTLDQVNHHQSSSLAEPSLLVVEAVVTICTYGFIVAACVMKHTITALASNARPGAERCALTTDATTVEAVAHHGGLTGG